MRKTIQKLLAEYGAIAVVIYFTIFFAVLFGFWAAIRFGWQPTGVIGGVGTLTAAYVATKLTQPLRLGATVLLTPIIARLFGKGRKPVVDPPVAPAVPVVEPAVEPPVAPRVRDGQ